MSQLFNRLTTLINLRIWCVSLCLIFVLAMCSTLSAQQQAKVGDEVRFNHLGKDVTGKVLEINKTGWYKVEFEGTFGTQNRTLSPRNIIEVVGGSGNPAASSEPEMREWSDRKEENTIKGKFVDLVDDTVLLEGENGKPIKIKISLLKMSDAKIARTLKAAKSAKDAGGDAATQMGASGGGSAQFPVTAFDFSTVFKTTPGPSTESWNVQPMKALDITSLDKVKKWFSYNAGTLSWMADGVAADPRDLSKAFVHHHNMSEGSAGYVVDFKTGKTTGPYTIPRKKSKVLAFDAKMNRVLSCTSGLGTSRRPQSVDVWQLDDAGKMKLLVAFNPQPDEKMQQGIAEGRFLDSQKIVLTKNSEALLFNLATKKAEAEIAFDMAPPPAIRLDGRYVYGLINKHYVAFDMTTGKTAGGMNYYVRSMQSVAYNRDETKAVINLGRKIVIWDLKANKQIAKVIHPSIVGIDPFFLDDDNVLISQGRGAVLINIPLQSTVWRYELASMYRFPGTTQPIMMFRDPAGKVAQAGFQKLPHPAAQKIIDNTKLADILAMPAGSEIFPETQRGMSASSKANIFGQFEKAGFKITSKRGTPFQLDAEIKAGETHNETYEAIGGGGEEKVTYTEQNFVLSLSENGRRIWYLAGSSGGGAGGYVLVGAGETVQDISDANTRTAADFFNRIELPDVFVRIPPGGVYGVSPSVGKNGFNDSK